LVRNAQDLKEVAMVLEQEGAFYGGVLVQHVASGALERAQAIFKRGSLAKIHCYRQLIPGIGGGDAMKKSLQNSTVADHLEQIGRKLNWHGPISVDYIFDESRGQPFYIDGNPRLVEPMNASLSGVDLLQAWLDLSGNQSSATNPPAFQNVKTHMALQVLLGYAQRRNSRVVLLRECWRLLRKTPPYDNSAEELTPFRTDPPSCVVVIGVLLLLLVAPRRVANILSAKSGAAHQLTPHVIEYVKLWRQQRCGRDVERTVDSHGRESGRSAPI
jgi:hypothetical protein